ncbi:unnamed protein product [Symbiodinium sp. CCMP2456]|nr:unnamed protein product [Symbiodinium sp. CCMP2456]
MEAVRQWISEQNPGVYRLCWCENNTVGACESLSDFNASAGMLTLRGPTKHATSRIATIGEPFTFATSGVWITTQSMMRLQHDCGREPDVVMKDAVAEVASGADLSYRFGLISEATTPAGRYKLCWCQPQFQSVPPSACTAAQEFLTFVADVTVICPSGQHGKNYEPCRGCPWFWQRPSRLREECIFNDATNFALVMATVICYLCGWMVLWYELGIMARGPGGRRCSLVGRKVHIEDISSCPSTSGEWSAIVTTTTAHRLSNRFGTFPIHFYQTGHHMLDSSTEACLYRARALSTRALQLLDARGRPVQGADTSHGFFVLSCLRSTLHSDVIPRVPVALAAPMLILCTPPLLVFVSEENEIPYSHSFGAAAALGGCLAGFVISRLLHFLIPKDSSIWYALVRFQEKLRERNPVPAPCNKGPQRALTAFQIFDFMNEFQHYIRDRNLYYIDSNIVRPLTSELKLSLAEVLGPCQVSWFVSHFWGTRFTYTCEALRRHAEAVVVSDHAGTSWESVSYWICAFSNNQYCIDEELGKSHYESSFYLALHSSSVQGTCMILDEHALPLTRSWCLFEVLQTMNLEKKRTDFVGLQFCTNTGVVNFGRATTEVALNIGKRLVHLSLADADATCSQDRDTIKSLVIQEMGSFDKIDMVLRAQIKKALVVSKGCIDDDFDLLFQHLDTGLTRVSL